MITRTPRRAAVDAYSATPRGSRWAESTRSSFEMPRSFSSSTAGSIASRSDSEPIRMPDERAFLLELLEDRVRRGCRFRLQSSCGDVGCLERAMSRRYLAPGKSMRSTAAYTRCSRAFAELEPSAVTLSTRPPALGPLPSRRAVPAWKTSAPSASASSMPRISTPDSARVRVAARGEHDGHRARPATRSTSAPSEIAGRRRGEGLEQVALETRQDDLGLGVAEAAVELEHPRPVLRQHQAGVEEPDEGRPPPRELARAPAGGPRRAVARPPPCPSPATGE